jgi:hypothetical protein
MDFGEKGSGWQTCSNRVAEQDERPVRPGVCRRNQVALCMGLEPLGQFFDRHRGSLQQQVVAIGADFRLDRQQLPGEDFGAYLPAGEKSRAVRDGRGRPFVESPNCLDRVVNLHGCSPVCRSRLSVVSTPDLSIGGTHTV